MGRRSQSRVVSLFILVSCVTSSNLEYYGIVKSDINTGCYYRMWPRLKSVSLWWLVKKKKTTKVSKPSKMRPSSSVASAPAQKEHRAASKNGTSAHTHTHMCARAKRGLPGRRPSTSWKNLLTDAGKPRTLRVCRHKGVTRHMDQWQQHRTTPSKQSLE